MRFARLKLTGPAIGIVAVLMMGTCTLPFVAAAKLDADWARREMDLVQRNIALWVEDSANALQAWAFWNESFDRLDADFDAAWVDHYIGTSILAATQSRFVAVISGSDEVLYSRLANRDGLDSLFARRSDAILREARLLLRDGRAVAAQTRAQQPTRKIAGSRIAMIDGTAILVTATIVQRYFQEAGAAVGHGPAIVTAMPIEGGVVQTFSGRFLLQDALLEQTTRSRHAAGAAHTDMDLAHATIASDGETMLQLVWIPARPGRAMLINALPFMGVVLLGFLAAVVALLGITRRAGNALIDSEEQLRHAAAHDVLTGLKNRRTFEDTLMRLAALGPLTVACFDLDGFKPVNDRFGHAAGDIVLRTIAARLERACRPEDAAFRLGGDEFALLLPGLTGEEARLVCASLSAILAGPIAIGKMEVRVGASVGHATVDGPASASTALLRADASLYRAKERSRQRRARAEAGNSVERDPAVAT